MKLLPRDVRVRRPRVSKATRMPLTASRVPRASSVLIGVIDASQRARLANAIRLDNRGVWFLCRSHWTVAQLERRFAEELVGTVLYHRVGGLLQGDKPYVYMQIALMKTICQQLHPDSEPEWIEVPVDGEMPDYDVTVALKEIQVTIVEKVDDIRDVLCSGRY